MNADQTVFAIASVSLDDDEARALLARSVGDLKPGSQEHSHSVLAKTPDGQKRIIALLEELAGWPKPAARFYMIHKRFALLGKLIDNWIEPTMYENGFDMTRDGASVSYLNMTWFCLPAFEGVERFESLLRAYQAFSRNSTTLGFERFFAFVEQLCDTSDNDSGKEMLAEILHARSLGAEHLGNLGEGAHDLAYPAAFSTIAHWDAVCDAPFAVVHDNSKNLRPVRPLLEAVMRVREGVERRRVGFDANLTYSLPFRSTSLTFADSKLHPQLQIADLVAGAAMTTGRYLLDHSHKPEYSQALIACGAMDTLRFGCIWPRMSDIKRRQPVAPGIGDPLAVGGRLLRNAFPQRPAH